MGKLGRSSAESEMRVESVWGGKAMPNATSTNTFTEPLKATGPGGKENELTPAMLQESGLQGRPITAITWAGGGRALLDATCYTTTWPPVRMILWCPFGGNNNGSIHNIFPRYKGRQPLYWSRCHVVECNDDEITYRPTYQWDSVS